MINETEPRDDVPEADWAEQQASAGPDADTGPETLRGGGATEADSADVAEQELEVVLDEED